MSDDKQNYILPVTLNLTQALKVLGWGRSKFFENIGHDANLRAVFFKEEGRRSKYTCYLHELMAFKERYRVGGRRENI